MTQPSRHVRTIARQVAGRLNCTVHGYNRQRGRWAIELLTLYYMQHGAEGTPYRTPRTVLLPEGVQ